MATSKTLASVPTTTDMTGKSFLTTDANGNASKFPFSDLGFSKQGEGALRFVAVPKYNGLGVEPSNETAYLKEALKYVASNFRSNGADAFVCTMQPGTCGIGIIGVYDYAPDSNGYPRYAYCLYIGLTGFDYATFVDWTYTCRPI